MRASIYTRVSTLEQAQKGYSLQAQEQKAREYCEYQGYTVEGIYCDDGFSGKDLNRPAISNLINLVKAQKTDIIIIYKLDRISRRVRDVIDLVEMLTNKGIQLYSLNDNIDLTTPIGRAMLKMSATWSELEREVIIERTVMGKNQRGLSGKMMCSGQPPFGYIHNKDKQNFETNPNEAEIIKEIFAKYINGISLRNLNDFCAEKFNHPYFNNSMSCKAILKRLMYTGYYSYKGEIIKGTNFESIIDLDTYYKARDKMNENKTIRKLATTPYLLTGLLYCSHCGARYYGKTRKQYTTINNSKKLLKQYQTYGCGTKLKPERHDSIVCDNKQISTKYLDNFVIDAIKNLKFTEFSKNIKIEQPTDVYICENIDIKKQREKLLDLFLSDNINKESFVHRAAKLDRQIEENNLIIVDLGNCELPQIDITILKDKILNFNTLPKNEQRRLLFAIIDKIIIDNELININWKVK